MTTAPELVTDREHLMREDPKMWMPGPEELSRGLSSVLSRRGHQACPITIVDRQRCVYASTSPMEIVTCRLGDQEMHLLVKYGQHDFYNSHGHRGGIQLEAAVYESLLMPQRCSVPSYYGTYTDQEHGRTWLVLEWIPNCLRVNKAFACDGMRLAGRWIARFHALNEKNVLGSAGAFLKKYDLDYYRGWAERTMQFSRDLDPYPDWIESSYSRYTELLPVLLDAAPTVIHGEYTSANVLFENGTIHPVDWESTAIGAGEIDLAQLTDRWSADHVQQIKEAYRSVRWPSGDDWSFEVRFDVARMFVQFHWLGVDARITRSKHHSWRFGYLKTITEHLATIEWAPRSDN